MKKLAVTVGMGIMLSVLSMGAGANDTERARVHFMLDAQPLRLALNQWAEQSGLSVMLPAGQPAAERLSVRVEGEYSPERALKLLLEDSGLTYAFVDEKTVAIRQPRVGISSSSSLAVADLRLADTSPPQGMDQGQDKDENEDAGVPEIVVTGTNLRGVAPVGSPLISYSAAQIRRSGATTVDQFFRTAPQTFSNIDASTTVGLSGTPDSRDSIRNATRAFTPNIHGLGLGATLTLVNGQRLAPTGTGGNIADISMIPLDAIERIDILADGASAIYGSDAVAGVVNIVLKRDYDGAQTSLRYGVATEGGAEELGASQLFGTAWDSGHLMATYSYQKRLPFRADQRSFIPPPPAGIAGDTILTPQENVHSAFFALHQQLAPGLELKADGTFAQRRAASSTTQETGVRGSFEADQQDYGAVVGLSYEFGSDWLLETTAAHSRSEGSGLFSNADFSIRAVPDSQFTSASFQLQGKPFTAGRHEVSLLLGTAIRREKFHYEDIFSIPDCCEFPTVSVHDRTVKSVYGELAVPFVGPEDGVAWASSLALSLAGRYDDYGDAGSTTNPKIGLAWEVIDGFTLRGTWGTSFRAPELFYLAPSANGIYIFTATEPGGAGATNVLSVYNYTNPQLKPESAETFSMGFDVRPPVLAGLTLGATYFDIRYRDRIATPPRVGGYDSVLLQPALEPLIVRNPDPALVDALILSAGAAYNNETGLPDDVVGASIGALYFDRPVNLASTYQSGIDFTASYDFPLGSGQATLSMADTYLIQTRKQVSDTAPLIEFVGTTFNPPRWRLRSSLAWRNRYLDTNVSVNYLDSSNNVYALPSTGVGSWTTVDMWMGIRMGQSAGAVLRDAQFSLSVVNLFDRDPPFVGAPAVVGFDAANATGRGRFVSVQLTKSWGHR